MDGRLNRDTNVKSFDYVLDMMQLAVEDTPTLAITGRVTQVIGTIIKAVVPSVKIGEVCILRQPGEDFEMKAEVVGFARDAALLPAALRTLPPRPIYGRPPDAKPNP